MPIIGMTDMFLKRFQIESIEQLPDYEQRLASIKVLEEGNAAKPEEVSLYNEFELPEEEETPDFLEAETDLQKIG